ncbi:aminodeoxychorismate lyase [Pseudoalteromonas ostreae]|uniref:aminodeoxychorismate lyase n=1 Tax=Pseudoalteromonas ostreae TaxID=2774154 RepID=UPI001B3742AA|nr:aminodeoxychorismate lyase [Pseudoalteromonas ostreae]
MQTIIFTDLTSTVSIKDRGLNYGDGFFTTAKVHNGEVEHWPLHCARLEECASRLGFDALDIAALTQAVNGYIQSVSLGVLKIVVTRGEGGRGYALPELPQTTILLSQLAFPGHYYQQALKGVKLAVSPIKLASQPLLAGLKTLNRLEQVMIKRAMDAQTCDDVLVCDYHNNVIEASAANIFAIHNGRIVSPNLQNCGIKGVYLQSLCNKLEIEFIDITLSELLQMDAVYLCNSLMAIVPVLAIADTEFDLTTSLRLLHGFLAKESAC